MILIQDGYMIDPKSGKEGNFDILIDGDKIVKIAEKIEPKGKVTRINAEWLVCSTLWCWDPCINSVHEFHDLVSPLSVWIFKSLKS